MKKMFYAVAVIATMAVCSCGNKAQNAEEAEIVEGEAIEVVNADSTCCNDSAACGTDSCATTPCDSCKNVAE